MGNIDIIRRTSLELHLEQRVMRLENVLNMLGSTLCMNFPTIPGLSQFGHGGGVHSGPPICPADPDDEAFFRGHGPRFVAKYNLLETNEQRMALLESLQLEGCGHANTYSILELLKEFRLYSSDYNPEIRHIPEHHRDLLAKEWREWRNSLHENNLFLERSKFPSLKEFLANKCPRVGDDVQIPEFYYYFKDAYGRNGPKDELILIPVPEIMGYVVINHYLSNIRNHGEDWAVSAQGVIRWSSHELRWLELSSSAIPLHSYNAAISRWMGEMGYPLYKPMDHLEMAVPFNRIRDLIVNTFHNEIDRKVVGKRIVTVGEELELHMHLPHPDRHYDDWQFVFHVKKGTDYIEAGTRFRAALNGGWTLDATSSVFQEDDGRIKDRLAEPKRQYAEIHRMVDEFGKGALDNWHFEDEPRS